MSISEASELRYPCKLVGLNARDLEFEGVIPANCTIEQVDVLSGLWPKLGLTARSCVAISRQSCKVRTLSLESL